MVELLSGITLWLGLFFLAIGSIGIIKMPDIYCKLHASGKCDTLGIFLAFSGISMQADNWHQILKIFLTALRQRIVKMLCLGLIHLVIQIIYLLMGRG